MKITRRQLRRIIREQKAVVTKDAIKDVVMGILSDEGGAAGLEPIERALKDLEDDETSLPDKPIEDIVNDVAGVKRHVDGDFIDTTQLEGASKLRKIIREEMSGDKLKCPRCGHLNHAGIKKCSNCGLPYPDKFNGKSWKVISEKNEGLSNLRKLVRTSIRSLMEQAVKYACPPATQDLEINTKNRNSAIKADYIQYGPLNLADEEYWVRAAKHWNTTVKVAKESRCYNCVAFDISPRMQDCMPGLIMSQEEIEAAIEMDERWETLGYCWMHKFKCHSDRSCYTWAAGGPITEDEVSHDWQERNE